MVSTTKNKRRLVTYVFLAVLILGMTVVSPLAYRSHAASYKTVTSCKNLTVKKVSNQWVTVNAKGTRVIYTGVASNSYGWWRVENGIVNFKATGLYQNDYGWWRVENGKVNFNASSIYQNAYGWWKTTGGKVTFNENGVFQNSYGWWKVENSKVNFNFTGVAINKYGDWWLEKGKVNFNANGVKTYNKVRYYVVNGEAVLMQDFAMVVAQSLVDDTPYSYKALVVAMTDDSLKDSLGFVFTINEAEKGIKAANIDWDKQALYAALDYLADENGDPTGESRASVKEYLKALEFTSDNISYVIKNIGSNDSFWKSAALMVAKDYVKDNKSTTNDQLKKALVDGYEFTETEAAYAIANLK